MRCISVFSKTVGLISWNFPKFSVGNILKYGLIIGFLYIE